MPKGLTAAFTKQNAPGEQEVAEVIMTGSQKREVERRIDDYFYLGEKILVRALLFGCFILEVGRVVWGMLR